MFDFVHQVFKSCSEKCLQLYMFVGFGCVSKQICPYLKVFHFFKYGVFAIINDSETPFMKGTLMREFLRLRMRNFQDIVFI